MDDTVLHAVEDPVVDVATRQHRADGDEAAGERLRDYQDVRLHARVLEREELAGATQSGLHLVENEERAVTGARPLRRKQVIVVSDEDPLALDRLEHEGGDVTLLELAIEGREITTGDRVAAGDERIEAVAEMMIAVQRQRAVCQTVKSVITVEDPWTPRGAVRVLDRGLDAFGSGAREVDRVEARRDLLLQLLREQSGEQRRIHLDEGRRLGLHELAESLTHHRMIASDVEDAVAGEHVQVALAGAVEEVRALRAHVDPVEPDRLEDPGELRVDMIRVELEVLPLTLTDQVYDVEGHALTSRVVGSRSSGRTRRDTSGSSPRAR